jgi:hypothetical protein
MPTIACHDIVAVGSLLVKPQKLTLVTKTMRPVHSEQKRDAAILGNQTSRSLKRL